MARSQERIRKYIGQGYEMWLIRLEIRIEVARVKINVDDEYIY